MLSGSAESRPVVLLVEDEPLVRMFNADVLDEAGFRVIEAATGEEALALFDARPDIGAVLTDIEMPGTVDGIELARRVTEHRPYVGVLIVSGRRRLGSREVPDGSRFLAKPYTPADLLRGIEQVMQGGSKREG